MRSAFLFFFLLPALFTKAQNPGSIPDSIKNYTILIMKAEQGIMQNSYNRKLERAFKMYYTGPFELVGKKDLEDNKYADLTKYRYTVNYYQTGFVNNPGGRSFPILDIVIHDRLENKDLNRPGIEATTYIDDVRQLGKMLEKKNKK